MSIILVYCFVMSSQLHDSTTLQMLYISITSKLAEFDNSLYYYFQYKLCTFHKHIRGQSVLHEMINLRTSVSPVW